MKKNVLFVTVAFVLLLGIAMTGRVSAAERKAVGRGNYKFLEKEYLEEVQQILLEKGCKNAGVTLTYVTDREGTREYTLTIHHARLRKMEQNEYILLQARIQEKAQELLVSQIFIKQI